MKMYLQLHKPSGVFTPLVGLVVQIH
jgi:hypothetical protein